MKKKFKEKNKLPLIFNYIETFKNQIHGKSNNVIYILNCKKYQTNFYIKSLVRLL